MKASISLGDRAIQVQTGTTHENAPVPFVTRASHLRISYLRHVPRPGASRQKDSWGRVLTAAIVMVTLAVAFYLMVLTDINYPL